MRQLKLVLFTSLLTLATATWDRHADLKPWHPHASRDSSHYTHKGVVAARPPPQIEEQGGSCDSDNDDYPSRPLDQTIGHPHQDENTLKPEQHGACAGNTPSTRSQWCDLSIDTDYTTVAPRTGVVREYWLELTEVMIALDGVPRTAMAVNGSIPGPTIFADWGDEVYVHVTNKLFNSLNGTSIHFHGIRQNFTKQSDGVPSITECPAIPGETRTYHWRAVQYGSSWYHSHFGLQLWQGVFGSIVINGPATANYDEDLGAVFLNDWDHRTVDELHPAAEVEGPPFLATGLINGTNTFGDVGQRLNISFEAGKSYRMRFVNAAIDTHWKFMLDNHKMTVIAADLVPIQPYTTDVVAIGIGQRYDVIIKADQQHVDENFWLRAIPQTSCSRNNNTDNIRAVVHYGKEPSTPCTQGYNFTDACEDEVIVPHVPKDLTASPLTTSMFANLTTIDGRFRWTLNSTTMVVDWGNPTALQILDGVTSFAESNAVIQLPEPERLFSMVIDSDLPIPHPIHLHGHDFFVLGQGNGRYSSENVTLNWKNPPRRDTAMLPGSGYLVIAFETDNPGAWLMHCHIGWHTSEGFALQFLERVEEIRHLINETALREECRSWNEFQDRFAINQTDSGV
ncbi:hypothetical protein CP533_0092 [Ophiocordyceps camponoti-saundersi (nom. inval.)]|nr:hypothetical protein CP533_0092 [Ophiocordyceps camponoti-saundersi (nom. inval.)]